MKPLIPLIIMLGHPTLSFASTSNEHLSHLSLTGDSLGIMAIAVFFICYGFVIAEEFLHLRKSKPVLAGAGIIWVFVALLSQQKPEGEQIVESAIQHNLMEYSALFLFLLTAMTYVNAMTERNVFEALRSWLVRKGFSYKKLFWLTGILAFFISPIADNLTTALLMGAVVLAVGNDKPDFVAVSFINIVVASNAGGAFSPFGDITTLMVWQSGHVDFFEFFSLFIPSIVNYLIPALLMSLVVSKDTPQVSGEAIHMKPGAIMICLLFLCTIATAVSFEQFLHLPPFLGMMTGLSYLFLYSYYLQLTKFTPGVDISRFNIFDRVAHAEWDTLLFFFGVIFCVGGLGTIGYLTEVSSFMYDDLGPMKANILAGILSAVIDNIPVMFAILTMNPDMSINQWLLITLTAGVGGSLLSVGSAAGVALMGQSKGKYTFFSHLKWSWAIAIGYAASIYVHFLISN